SGAVLAEIPTQPATYYCGIQYWPQHPGSLLVTDCGGSIFQMDIVSGMVLGDALFTVPGITGIESIAVRSTAAIYVAPYDNGHLYAYDPTLVATPGFDRTFVVGLGISASNLTFNYDSGEIIVRTVRNGVYSVAKNLKTSRFLFDLSGSEAPASLGINYLG